VAAQSQAGSPQVYAAPETFDGSCRGSADQYSLACVIRRCFTGQTALERTKA